MRRQGIQNQNKDGELLIEEFLDETKCHPCLIPHPPPPPKPVEEVVVKEESVIEEPVVVAKGPLDSDSEEYVPLVKDVPVAKDIQEEMKPAL